MIADCLVDCLLAFMSNYLLLPSILLHYWMLDYQGLQQRIQIQILSFKITPPITQFQYPFYSQPNLPRSMPLLQNIYVMHGKQNCNPNIHTQQKQTATRTKTKTPLHSSIHPSTLCSQHQLSVGNIFCQDCLSFNLCSECLLDHPGHSVKRFRSFQVAKEETKELLLMQVEQTLGRLKSRQNELKSKMSEVNLIKQKIKLNSQQLIADLKQQLEILQRKMQDKLTLQFEKYEKQLDSFYREYNSVNNSLRESLEQIIDGTIDMKTFGRHSIHKQINKDSMPQFTLFKYAMEKFKKNVKGIRDAWREVQSGCRHFNNEQERSLLKFEKYDKFLKQKSYNQEHNASLMKTLNILQDNQQDLAILKAKLKM